MRTITAVLIASIFFGVGAAFAESAEDVARRFLTLAYDGRFEQLPKSAQANTDAFERKVRNSFRARCLDVGAIDRKSVSAGDDGVTLEWEVTLIKRARDTQEEWTENFPLRLKLVQNSGRWLVSAVEFPDYEFAQQLLAASDAEAAQLLRDHPDRMSRSLARALYERALALLNGGKFDSAARATALTREVAIVAGDRGGEALALGVSVFVFGMSGNGAEALRLSGESLSIAESLGDPDVLARAWYNRGRTGQMSGGVGDAERSECYRKAMHWAERAEDPTLLVRVLYSLANAATISSDGLTARLYLDRMIPLAHEVGDISGEGAAEMVLATIYFGQGDVERGLFHDTRALKLAETHLPSAYPSLLLRSAVVLAESGRFDQARAVFSKVLTRDERGTIQTRGSVPSGHVRDALLALATMEAENGRLDEAECILREASFDQPDYRWLFKLAPSYIKRRNYAAALRFSLPSVSNPLGDTTYRIEALVAAARAYFGLGQHQQALATILEAIEIRESTTIAGDERQRALMSDRTAEHYKLAAEIVLDCGDPMEALVLLERGRGIVLTDILENGRPRATLEADAANEEERRRREGELARLSIEADRLRMQGTQAAVDAASARLDQARAEHATFVDGILARSERRLATRKYADGQRLAEIIKRLPARTVAIEYLVTDQQLHLFVARNGAVTHRAVEIDRARLDESVNRFTKGLAQRRVQVTTFARDLHDLLIRPIEQELFGAEALVVIPDELLWRVPFAALVGEDGRFLVERLAIVYAQSITVYSLMSKPKETSPTEPLFFAVSNPTLGPSSKNAFTSFYRDATLDALPDAEREVEAVQPLYRRSLLLERAEATEARTKSMLGDASIVHFATHGLFDDVHPMYSRLALARDSAAIEDGWLEAWEIMRLDLHADLVILSACETARGRIGGGEGVVGMAWSFFVAGARSTLATQWKVGSEGSADLMIAFHKALRARGAAAPLSKAKALRDAQLRLMREERYAHPFYWAGFVILGGA